MSVALESRELGVAASYLPLLYAGMEALLDDEDPLLALEDELLEDDELLDLLSARESVR